MSQVPTVVEKAPMSNGRRSPQNSLYSGTDLKYFIIYYYFYFAFALRTFLAAPLMVAFRASLIAFDFNFCMPVVFTFLLSAQNAISG